MCSAITKRFPLFLGPSGNPQVSHRTVGTPASCRTGVLIGTSGWHYDSWRRPFFPKGLPLKSQLQFYASQFPSAELNGVFYRTPTPEAVESWRFPSCSRGEPRSSSPTGNDCRKARPTVSNFSKTAFPYLETKSARSFFSFHRTSGRTKIGSVSFSRCCRATAGTASSFAIRVGIPRASSKCWPSGISPLPV
jgi:hypothetical protein